MKLTKISVSLPFNLGTVEIEPNTAEREAAWDIYVELTTRIASQELAGDAGTLRETLDSLYSLFDITREVLREHGSTMGKTPYSVGAIAIQVLNKGIRPFVSKWHPLLLSHEQQRAKQTSIVDHEASWKFAPQFRGELKELQKQISIYADALALIADVALE